MEKAKLARQLRREWENGIISHEEAYNVSDDKLIESYVSCPGCGSLYISKEKLNEIIKQSVNARKFIKLCTRTLKALNPELNCGEHDES
jgi:hypothetical protein